MSDQKSVHYRYRLGLGTDPLTGKYEYTPWYSGFQTRSEAQRAMEQRRAELESGLRADANKTSLFDYADQYLEFRSMKNLSKATLTNDRQDIDKIKRFFPNMPITDLDSSTMKRAYVHAAKDGMSQYGIYRMHSKLKQMLEEAIIDDLILRNPAKKIRMPRPAPAERNSLTTDEALRLFSIVHTTEKTGYMAAVLLGLSAGLRRGECLGLTWDHVDFAKGSIYIAKQFTKDRELKAPKSKSGLRKLYLDSKTLGYLAEWKAMQGTLMKERGLLQTKLTPVASNEDCTFADPANFSKWFNRFCETNGFGEYKEVERTRDAKGIPRIKRKNFEGLKFHELRHTQATLLFARGADIKSVQKRLGHSTATLTLNLYAHSMEEQDRQAATIMEDLFDKAV